MATIALVAVAAFIVAHVLDATEEFLRWANSNDNLSRLHLDEVPSAAVITSIAVAWNAWRRRREYRQEAERHASTAEEQRATVMQLREPHEALSTANARLRDAIETIPEGFALFDADDRYVSLEERGRLLAIPP